MLIWIFYVCPLEQVLKHNSTQVAFKTHKFLEKENKNVFLNLNKHP